MDNVYNTAQPFMHNISTITAHQQQQQEQLHQRQNTANLRHSQLPKRTTSLVRPERSRIDPQHPQYHTRRRIMLEDDEHNNHYRDTQFNTTSRSVIRRGLLGREEDFDYLDEKFQDNNMKPTAAYGATGNATKVTTTTSSVVDYVIEDQPSKTCSVWITICYLLTCCCPPPLLRAIGRKDKNAQMAFREKIGLVTVILGIMAMVGFLTFGFTQVVCPRPPLSFRVESINDGYVIVHGWAYMLASWNDHPPIAPAIANDISGNNNKINNVMDEPFNASGKDASFLFQNINGNCLSIIKPKDDTVVIGHDATPGYFPCQLLERSNQNENDNSMNLINSNNASSPYANNAACHVKSASRQLFTTMRETGVINSNGNYDKAGRVYYDWEDVNKTSHLAVYNSNVLNLNLLQLLLLSTFSVPENGLIEAIINDKNRFGGQDITHIVATHRNQPLSIDNNTNKTTSLHPITWKAEAQCLLDIIKVGEVDTKSFGCIVSDVVLYTSLMVILGVILVKFGLAVIFGWFLSWKLGNFKNVEGKTSYKDRMRRDLEIEDWTAGINVPAAAIRPQQSQLFGSSNSTAAAKLQHHISSPNLYHAYNNSNKILQKKRSIIPTKSRFTQPDTGTMHFKSLEHQPSTIWQQAPTGPRGMGKYLSSQNLLSPRPTLSVSDNRSNMTSPLSRRSSQTSATTPINNNNKQDNDDDDNNTSSSNATAFFCPYELSPYTLPQPKADYKPFGFPLAHTICLVTCYSEGEEGLRTTLDSIATTDYPNSHKLLLVIADGMITGHGNKRSTPDICISMMKDFLVPPEQVEACSYIAIADGTKRHNMSKVYAGFYNYNPITVDRKLQKRVPMVTIVKCGTPAERQESANGKPGNRGKRDSQVILMSFLQKVMFDERMTELEYELFTTLWRISGISPDKYETVLMVDADTKVYPDALSRLISCMVNDPEVMGLCGETKIGNKTDSWVSMIQVFEYYISHHQSKAFESIFGNVTCLPGCFCMYRIKAPKGHNGHWVPILANPDIIEHYSENVVDTLHKKNLLLLGEDRYLSTLMLKTFPRRKMLFVPQAVCKTVVPDSFAVLLSQRRRWINSTIHNLMELLFVHDLCGTFCLSMQFVVFMELVGTLALPAAISFTMYLIILACIGQPAVLSLILLALILGLPAVLIVMTSRKLVYVGWMFIYLFSLPIWNFVLPTYAYWHFDDFSWGETRKVEGEGEPGACKDHSDKEGEFDSSQIMMKKWVEYERDRKMKEAETRERALFEQQQLAITRWTPMQAELSLDLDRSTLSTLIDSSLGNNHNSSLNSSARFIQAGTPPTTPPLPPPSQQHLRHNMILDDSNTYKIEEQYTSNTENNDMNIDEDEIEESLSVFPSITLPSIDSTTLPTFAFEKEDTLSVTSLFNTTSISNLQKSLGIHNSMTNVGEEGKRNADEKHSSNQIKPPVSDLIQSLRALFKSWELDYKRQMKKEDFLQETIPSFIALVNDMHRVYQQFFTAVKNSSSKEYISQSPVFRENVQRLMLKLIPDSFFRVLDKYQEIISDQIEVMYERNMNIEHGFAYLFCPDIRLCHRYNDFEKEVQLVLDANLPDSVTVLNLTEDELDSALKKERQRQQCGNEPFENMSQEQWLPYIKLDTTIYDKYDLKQLHTNLESFDLICQQLHAMDFKCDWIERVKKKVIKRLKAMNRYYEDNWTISILPFLLKWCHVLLLPWISYLLPKEENNHDANWFNFLRAKTKLEHIMYEAFYYTRIPHIFDIIVDFPDSKQTITDFQIVITRRGMFDEFKSDLMQQLKARLLHQGASAIDILHQYIVCIECLKIIDPSCEILAPVIDLIKNYMNAYRKDTVRGVVELIREANDEEEEFVRFPMDPDDVHVFDEAELNNTQRIRTVDDIPEGRLTKLSKLQKKIKDPIAMLISVCKSLKEFIHGYSNRFGEALLLCTNYNTEEEERRLEFLKRNFPPDTFLRCDIMLQDMANSRRLDKIIHESGHIQPIFHSIMMSKKYWQGDNEDHDYNTAVDDDEESQETVSKGFKRYLPFDDSLATYQKEFERVKVSRKLKFSHTKGSVSLTLNFNSREPLNVNVTPEEALVIQLFQSKDQKHTMEHIHQETGMSMNKVATSLTYWMENDVLELSANGYFSLVNE
ncbi:chitin synthase-domain-containing protein [Mycotypha africana]|uniref:chitin synthase-domain-containing protein n=1 Tax=Mycotypha africana TaxID=64632 RepID=UPI0023018596|nr:chitin synthase-domain-containing protein [Mycotypha africana]KAI8984115.1 chitin synthase-domain-containing protein [Mycotypha africana]